MSITRSGLFQEALLSHVARELVDAADEAAATLDDCHEAYAFWASKSKEGLLMRQHAQYQAFVCDVDVHFKWEDPTSPRPSCGVADALLELLAQRACREEEEAAAPRGRLAGRRPAPTQAAQGRGDGCPPAGGWLHGERLPGLGWDIICSRLASSAC